MRTNRNPALLAVVLAIWCVGVSAQAPAAPLSAVALEKLRSAAFMEMPVALQLDPRIAAILTIGDDNEQVPSVRLTWLRPEGRHFIYFSLKDGTDDIVLSVLTPGLTKLYLTNSNLVLRGAGALEPVTAHVVPLAQAAADFQAELRVWAASAAAVK